MLTLIQINAILALLLAFNVDAVTIQNVERALRPPVAAPIVQTTPEGTPTIPATIPTVDASIPSRLEVKTFPANTVAEVIGANCQEIAYTVTVFDQNGNAMSGQDVTMTAVYDTQTLKSPATFRYWSKGKNMSESVQFRSGGVSTASLLHVRSGLDDKTNEQIIQAGLRYDSVTRMCL